MKRSRRIDARGNLRRLAVAFVLLSLAFTARAVDRYRIEAPAVVMAGDTAEVRVIPLQGAEQDDTAHRIEITGLPAGVGLEPRDRRGVPVAGPKTFSLSLSETAAAGPFVLRVRKTDDRRALGMTEIAVERPVASFSLTPSPRPFAGVVGRPFRIQLIARDAQGAVVTSFKGDVNLTAAVGAVEPSVIPEDAFRGGIAELEVRLTATDPATRKNHLEAVARRAAAGVPARGVVDLSLKLEAPTP